MNSEIPISRFEIFASGLDHPEGLAFDCGGNLWSGGEAGQIYRVDPSGRVEEVVCTGGFHVFSQRVRGREIMSANHLVFTSSGTLYASDSGRWKERNGCLLRFSGSAESGDVAGGPFGYANGLALSQDERFLFMVESDSSRIYRFEIGPSGALSPPQLWKDAVGRVPDGLALDARRNLYVCCYASDDIYRLDPSGGLTLWAHDPEGVLLGRPTNMAFGGADFSELYVANLGRYTISRVQAGRRGWPLANQRKRVNEHLHP